VVLAVHWVRDHLHGRESAFKRDDKLGGRKRVGGEEAAGVSDQVGVSFHFFNLSFINSTLTN